MQNIINATAGPDAVIRAADVALDEFEPRPLGWLNNRFHLIKVALIAGREIVQPHHPLIEPEQRLEQIGANEAGDASDQPDPRPCAHLGAHFVVPGH